MFTRSLNDPTANMVSLFYKRLILHSGTRLCLKSACGSFRGTRKKVDPFFFFDTLLQFFYTTKRKPNFLLVDFGETQAEYEQIFPIRVCVLDLNPFVKQHLEPCFAGILRVNLCGGGEPISFFSSEFY